MTARNPEIDALRLRLKDMYDRVSRMRKKGVDTFFLNTRLLSVPARIQFAEATMLKKDIDSAARLMAELEAEVGKLESTQIL
ncbi:hypothetical protein HYU11_04585 [Candidatus Woesearchaeota archaeon]|nr:hypothetical protein [Candidatus Woesearchaeota archaeon]